MHSIHPRGDACLLGLAAVLLAAGPVAAQNP